MEINDIIKKLDGLLKLISIIISVMVFNVSMIFAILSGYNDIYTITFMFILNVVVLYNVLGVFFKILDSKIISLKN